MLRLVTFPFRAGVRVGATGTKVSYRTARLVGFKRLFLIGIGVGIGLLAAPVPGRVLRAKLVDLMNGGGGDGDLVERVRFELSHSPTTWNLPQPVIDVDGERVTLRGQVPHASAKADLERAANAVPGVGTVENLLDIAGTNGSH